MVSQQEERFLYNFWDNTLLTSLNWSKHISENKPLLKKENKKVKTTEQ
jgi:hypothetical protein